MIVNKILYMSDTVHGTIQISEIEKKIISTPIFNRLHNISQNSTAYLTFATNRTKRFEHSIGTMHLAGKMFYSSIANAESNVLSEFFNQIRKIINSRIDEVLARRLYKYEIGDRNYKSKILKEYNKFEIQNTIKNIWIPSNINQNDEFLCMVVSQAVRLAALLHDVGHPPFSHIAENALKTIWAEIDYKEADKRNECESEYHSILEKYFKDDGELHEQIGNNLTDRVLETLIDTMPRQKEQDTDSLANQLFLIMIKEMTSAILNERKLIFNNIHKLIDGSLDCDRLDYVSRDVMNSGFNNGIIEYDRLISSMRLFQSANKDFIFCPNMKVLNNVEDFFERRWNLYKQIIFHHRVIKTDYLLNNCIQELINRYLCKNEKQVEADNDILPYNISGLWLAVKGDPSNDVFFNQIIQWDDSWLMVVLKKEYLSMDDGDSDSKILKSNLKELLANEKYYYSIIKKPENFIEIEKQVVKSLYRRLDNLKEQIKEIQETKPEHNNEHSKTLVIDPFINDLTSMISNIENYEKNNYYSHNGFILSKIKNLIFNNYLTEEDFVQIVRSSVEEISLENTNIEHAIVEFKNIKLGVQKALSLYSSENLIETFKNISNVPTLLMFQKEFLPPFFIYISKKDIETKIDYIDFKKKIGDKIAEKIICYLDKLFLEYK